MIILREFVWLKDLRNSDGKIQLGDKVIDLTFGWGCGYVIVKKGHPMWGVDQDNPEIYKVRVHGNSTYTVPVHTLYMAVGGNQPEELEVRDLLEDLPHEYKGGWVFGFDTAHHGDNLENWSKENVRKEAERLENELKNMEL